MSLTENTTNLHAVLIQRNMEYKAWKEKTQAEMATKQKAFVAENASITAETLQNLSLTELKDIKNSIGYPYTELKAVWNLLEELIEKKRLEDYPTYNKAKYYPFLNTIDFLPVEDIIKVDNYLFKKGTRSTIHWNEIVDLRHYDSEVFVRLFNVLLANNAIEVHAKLDCPYCANLLGYVPFEYLKVLQDVNVDESEKESYMCEMYCESCRTNIESISEIDVRGEHDTLNYKMKLVPCTEFLNL